MSAADLNGSREKTVKREKRLHKFSTRQTCETAAETTKSTNLSEVTVDALKTSSSCERGKLRLLVSRGCFCLEMVVVV